MDENAPLIANTNNGCDQTQHTKYQQLASFMSRELWLYQLACKLSNAPAHDQKPWLRHLHNAAQANQYVTQTLWPMVFFIMQLHDVIRFFAYPEERYDTSFWQLLHGTQTTNEQSISADVGSTLVPDPTFFWGSSFLLYMGWIATMLAFVIYRRHWDQDPGSPYSAARGSHLLIQQHTPVLPVNNDDASHTFAATDAQQQAQPYHAMRDAVTSENSWAIYRMHLLAHIAFQRPDMLNHCQIEINRIAKAQQPIVAKSLLQYYANYLTWSVGTETPKAKHIPFWLITLYANYAQLRFFMLPLIKLAQFTDFHTAQQQCETANKVWSLMTLAGQYLCTACGDWPFATLKEATTVAGCAAALARQSDFTPEQLATHYAQITTVHNDPLRILNLTQQPWGDWTASQLKTLFDSLQPSANTLTTLDLSVPSFSSHLNHDTTQALVTFISQLSLLVLKLSNIALDEGRLTQLMPALIEANPETLTMAGCSASEQDLLNIAHNLSSLSKLQTWDLSGTKPQMRPSPPSPLICLPIYATGDLRIILCKTQASQK